jgi:hypothetical protein
MNEGKIVNEEIDWMERSNTRWVEQHLDEMSIGSYWTPEGMGFMIQKIKDKKINLVRCINHHEILKTIAGLKLLVFDLGYTFSEDDANFDDLPSTQDEAVELEKEYEDVVISSWKCECGFPIVEMDARKYFPTLVDTTEYLDEQGELKEREWWGMPLICPSCSVENMLTPDVFLKSHSERLLHRATHDGVIYQAHTRYTLAEIVEDGEYDANNFKTFGFTLGGEKLPHWMQGQHCEMIVLEDGEEE